MNELDRSYPIMLDTRNAHSWFYMPRSTAKVPKSQCRWVYSSPTYCSLHDCYIQHKIIFVVNFLCLMVPPMECLREQHRVTPHVSRSLAMFAPLTSLCQYLMSLGSFSDPSSH